MSDWVGSLGKDKDCVEMGVDRDPFISGIRKMLGQLPCGNRCSSTKTLPTRLTQVLREVYNCSSQVLATEEKNPQNKN